METVHVARRGECLRWGDGGVRKGRLAASGRGRVRARLPRTAILSFIATFGLAKALSKLMAGRWGDRYGRKAVLVAGWVVGLPVPLIVMWAPTWEWIVLANVLLGINQGLAWSTTVIMKIDLVGPRQRGLAVSLAALASGYVAATYTLRPEPFYLGIAFALAGLLPLGVPGP